LIKYANKIILVKLGKYTGKEKVYEVCKENYEIFVLQISAFVQR